MAVSSTLAFHGNRVLILCIFSDATAWLVITMIKWSCITNNHKLKDIYKINVSLTVVMKQKQSSRLESSHRQRLSHHTETTFPYLFLIFHFDVGEELTSSFNHSFCTIADVTIFELRIRQRKINPDKSIYLRHLNVILADELLDFISDCKYRNNCF